MRKKKCQCGFIVSGKSIASVVDALRDHCDHKGCDPAVAKNV